MKELQFMRRFGLSWTLPCDFIDDRLPVCPFCKRDPRWEIARETKLKWNLYHFRCAQCHGTLSTPVAAVANVAISPGTLGSLLLRPAANKGLTVQNIGSSGADLVVGKEYSAEELRTRSGPQPERI
jgi:hypothetical protein